MHSQVKIVCEILFCATLCLLLNKANSLELEPPVTIIYKTDEAEYRYSIVAAPLTWHKADQLCRQNNRDLATIRSAAAQAYLEKGIIELGYSSEQFWIGGNDLVSEGNFYWLRELPFVYKNWYTTNSEPNQGANGNCVALMDSTKNFQWGDASCSDKKYAICETVKYNRVVMTDRISVFAAKCSDKIYLIPNYQMDFLTAEDYCRVNGFSLSRGLNNAETSYVHSEISRLGLSNDSFWLLPEDGNCPFCDPSKVDRSFFSFNDCSKISFDNSGDLVITDGTACQDELYALCEKPVCQ